MFAERRRSFMRGLDFDDRKRKRQNDRVNLRKKDRQQILKKRRHVLLKNKNSSEATSQEVLDLDVELDKLPTYAEDLNSHDPSLRLHALCKLRQLVSLEENPPFSEVVAANTLVGVVRLLSDRNHPKLQLEAAWFLSNIASGDDKFTCEVVQAGAIEVFKCLCTEQKHNEALMRQCIWGLANISGDNTAFRLQVLGPEVLEVISNFLTCTDGEWTPERLDGVRDAAWCLSNLSRWKKRCVPPMYAKPITQIFVKALETFRADHIVAEHIMWGASLLCDLPPDEEHPGLSLLDLLNFGFKDIFPFVVECLSGDSSLLDPALRIVGYFLVGEDEVAQRICEFGIIPHVKNLLFHDRKRIVREAAWICTNMIVSPVANEVVCDTVAKRVIEIILQEPKSKVRNEACWCLANMLIESDWAIVVKLVEMGALNCVLSVLNEMETTSMLQVAMQMLERILEVGKNIGEKTETRNPFANMIEELGGVDKLETLQASDLVSEEIYEMAAKTILQHWEVEESTVASESETPLSVDGRRFRFGSGAAKRAEQEFVF